MKDIKEFRAWRAGEIAKVFLLSSGLVKLLPNYADGNDFLAVSKNHPGKTILVEVKPTKYSRGKIKKVYARMRKEFAKSAVPVIMMYIDYDNERGYFEVFQKESDSTDEIQVLKTDKLEERIAELIG